MTPSIRLFSFYRSSCGWRARTALYWKEVPFEPVYVNTFKGDHRLPFYAEISPTRTVPTMVVDDSWRITQSSAILEYLEEAIPRRHLLYRDPMLRAQVRSIVSIIVSDIQPLQSPRTLWRFKDVALEDPESVRRAAKEVVGERFKGLERALESTHGRYSVGDKVTMADVCLVPMVFNAHLYGVDMTPFPLSTSISERLLEEHEPFRKAHPRNQPDNEDEYPDVGWWQKPKVA
ncbi:Maleylacetoacetate isomerase [Gonapodya prolifera JEL478]|uniref:Maleylacetoacetate isomerase n=1 Tax=Gonapodya prolifera (strain JEL478) TaxID=1344416 RepID=A0A139AUH5_GONPJ|nr:Maleylacetoacetate isomerase [Gonapodya prolifera JEL478]|eukprot:KXS20396.1 Maleylacetoacetate isomerase [Gonapodya prolifera JEL478]